VQEMGFTTGGTLTTG
nr:immunoglobulin heavy chain junction region [Mus musculus]